MNLAVIIPTLNAGRTLPATLAALGNNAAVIVVDGGSKDGTLESATAWDAEIVRTPAGRGIQLIAGAAVARASWFLFLHADTNLEPGWQTDVE